MPKWCQWVLFVFSAVSAIGAVVKILEYFKVGPNDLGRMATISSHSLMWGIILAVTSVILFAGGKHFAKRKKTLEGPTLEFLAWHGGSSRSLPAVPSGTTTWVAVKNVAGDIPTDAVGVTARLEFTKSGGAAPLIVPEARWYAKHISAAGNEHEGWRDSVDIGAEDEQSFVLFVSRDDNTHWVYKSPDTLVDVLDAGRWEAKVIVSSDNGYGFEGKIRFLLTRNSLQPDAPAFTKQRVLKPRSQR